MKNLKKIICIWKLTSESNKKIGRGIYNNQECEDCDGYNIKCENYQPKPEWYGKD